MELKINWNHKRVKRAIERMWLKGISIFGIDFGIRECEICTKCGSEYLNDKTLEEIEREVKKRKLFGLEKEAQITKSGNSLVIRIPQEIVKFTGINYKDLVRIYPSGKNKIEVELKK